MNCRSGCLARESAAAAGLNPAETPRGLAFSKKLSRKQRKILLLAALRLRQK
jgi:hypothetical protein